jgi:hypothetical protein
MHFASSQIRAENIDQLLGALCACGRALLRGVDDVLSNVALEDLAHERVDGTTGRGDQVEDLGAVITRLDASLDRLDLSAKSTNPAKKLLVVSRVCHAPEDIIPREGIGE